jgi:hypothetical protein
MANETNTPEEQKPAYERSIDKESIDSRMQAQLDWEGNNRMSPLDTLSPKKDETRASNSRLAPKKVLAMGATAVALGAGVYQMGKAIDHELNTGKPNFPQPSGQVEKPTK